MHQHQTNEQKKAECLALLRSTNRPKIEDLINHITTMGYFEAPGSLKHHRFVGGLLSHSLETYHKAMELREAKIREGFLPDQMPVDSIIIAALMHDLCKADVLRYNPEPVASMSVKAIVVTVPGRFVKSVIPASSSPFQSAKPFYGIWEERVFAQTNN